MPFRRLILLFVVNTGLCLYVAFLYAFFFDALPGAGMIKMGGGASF